MREFWSGEWAEVENGHVFRDVPPHGVRVLTLSPLQKTAYLGSDLHLSQGIELSAWKLRGSTLSLELNLGREAEGRIYLYCQSAPASVTVDKQEVSWVQETDNLVSIGLSLNGKATVKVKF